MESTLRICLCGHSDVTHNKKSCKGITTKSHKGLDWSRCKCKKLDIAIDLSKENIHIKDLEN